MKIFKNPTHGFMQNIRILKSIYEDSTSDRPITTFIEKVVYSILIICRFFSLSNFGAFFLEGEGTEENKNWSNFLDIYLLLWPIFFIWILFKWPFINSFAGGIAIYQIVMIISNQLATLLVDSQRKGWAQQAIGRSFILTLINLTSIVLAYAIIYRAWNCVVSAGETIPELRPLQLLYYSLVTLSTLGNGDFLPNGDTGILATISELVTVVLFVLTVIPAYLNALSQRITREY